jgi:hypothetical protein
MIDAEANSLLLQAKRNLPSTHGLGQSQPLLRRIPGAGRNQISCNSEPMKRRWRFVAAKPLDATDCLWFLQAKDLMPAHFAPHLKVVDDRVIAQLEAPHEITCRVEAFRE